MALNIDNALAETQTTLSNLIRDFTYIQSESCWLVTFMGHDNEVLVAEILIRDDGLVTSVLNTAVYQRKDVSKIMDVFMDLLNIVP